MIRSLFTAALVALLALALPYAVFIPVHFIIKTIWSMIYE